MQARTIALCAIVSSLPSVAAQADDFKPWCDTYTAQGMVSLAANRIFGITTQVSAAENKERTQWVNDAYIRSEARFKKLTGKDFRSISLYEHGDWLARCQLKDQI